MAELEIRNLHVTAEGKEILKGVSLDVEKGSIHALMGPNGSGKSTLANAIMGHPSLEVTQGTITYKGEDITEAKPDAVHVLYDGRIVKEGGPELVEQLEEKGYGWIKDEVEAGAAA